MTIKAQINLEPEECERRLIRVCVGCGMREDEFWPAPRCYAGGGEHRFEDLPVCSTCGGEGGFPHPDPQVARACDDCEGVGARGPWSESASA